MPKGTYSLHQGKRGASANQEGNEKDGEESAPTGTEPELAGEFPLHLLIMTLPGTKLPPEAAVLLQSATAPDSPALPNSEPGAGHVSPLLMSSPAATQEAKLPLAMRLGPEGTRPGHGVERGRASIPHGLTAF